MTGLAAFINNALLSIGSCNSGTSAPANGSGGAAFAEECWANTTGAPTNIPFAYFDGAQWVTVGTLNATAHIWTPYFGGNPTIETAPLSGSVASGVLTLALQYDGNFSNNGSNQLALANVAAGNLLANGTAGSAEPTSTTPSAWLNQWCSGTQYNFPQRGASSWACGTISGLLIAGTGISLSGAGQVSVAVNTGASLTWAAAQSISAASSPQLTVTNPSADAAAFQIGGPTHTIQLDEVAGGGVLKTVSNGEFSFGTNNTTRFHLSAAGGFFADGVTGGDEGNGKINANAFYAAGSPLQTTAGSSGQLLVGQGTSTAPSFQSMSGDATLGSTGTLTIGAAAVSYAKIQNVTASRLLGNPGVSSASASEVSLGSTLAFSGTALQTGALSGDVTSSANSFATTIANNVVTNAKAAQMAANTVKGNPTGSAANAQDVTAQTARSSSLLNVDACSSTGSSAYVITATDRCIYHTALTAAVTDTLPAANAVNAGQRLYVVDFRGVASASNTITLQRSGTDTINGSASAVAVNAQYGWSVWMSDGISRWTYQQGGGGGGGAAGTVTNVGISAGAAVTTSGNCSITTSGTCTIAGTLFKYFLITASNSTWNIATNFGYTPTELFIEAWGGGASGGGENSNANRGAGGGAGQYFFEHYTGTMDTTLAITIGAGGVSCSSACGGVGGGSTSVAGTNLGTLTAHGGSPPTCSGLCAGGVGGAGTTGATFDMIGGDGYVSLGGGAWFGFGGDSPRGGMGGKSNVANPGRAPGGGGSGENHTGGGSGAGAQGWVLIHGR